MSRRYWLPLIAVVGLTAVALAQAPERQGAAVNSPASAAQSSAEASKGRGSAADAAATAPVQSPADKAVQAAQNSQQEKPASDCPGCDAEDLRQQTRMADAAERQIDVNILMAILTGVAAIATAVAAVAAANAASKAKEAIEQSERHANIELRAYLFGKGGFGQRQVTRQNIVGEKSVKGYEFWLPYENFGATPAHEVRCEITADSHPMNEDSEVVQNDYPMGNRLIIGPRAGGSTGIIDISVSDAMECWRRETEIVICVTFEYFDVFERDRARTTEYRVRLDPVIPPNLVAPEGSKVFNLIPFGANQST